ncbi:flagellar capping protein FliD [Symbiobacterium terraclitae]|uniref:Flagellar hook-associated protein 2 n=1 Tax=Symbiobacterium terraclitae TaxID=557451 RepID=A0ABS4JNC2_9FIRM|nr:flagellar filament capping protein FliD [Symbiobacterium terraclitae]MBP2017019.1 flagellar capping protein FliD [Symbiobacterium terraclitae]
MSGLGLSGLISGGDTRAIIEKILRYELERIENRERDQQKLEKKQQAWRDVRSALTNIQSKLDALRLPFVYRSRKVTLTDESVATISAAQGSALTSYSLAVLSLAQTHVITQRDDRVVANPNAQLGISGTFRIGNDPADLKEITIEADDTLHSLADKINAANAGVRANVMAAGPDSYRLVLTSDASGTANAIRLEEVAGTPLQELGLLSGGGSIANELSAAQDAVFTLNGIQYVRATNTVDDAVPGLTITLKKVTGAGNPVQATVELDPDKVLESVKGWVDAVNSALSLMAKLTSYNTETREAGILNGEMQIRRLQTTLRSMVANEVSGLPHNWRTLMDVGISTGAYGSADYGKLVIDEKKFKEALAKDAEAVATLFGAMRVNPALEPGTSITVIGTGDGSGRLTDLINGVTDSDRFGSTGGGWEGVGAPSEANPHVIEITFASARTIDQIVLYQPDNLASLKAFTLEYWDETSGSWKALATVDDYNGAVYTANFDPKTTSRIRLSVTATHGDAPVRLTEIQVGQYNRGAAAEMSRYLRQLLDVESGMVENREKTLASQIKRIRDTIGRLEEQLTARQKQLEAQFARMEEALARLQAQGNAFAAMLMGFYS